MSLPVVILTSYIPTEGIDPIRGLLDLRVVKDRSCCGMTVPYHFLCVPVIGSFPRQWQEISIPSFKKCNPAKDHFCLEIITEVGTRDT